MSGFGVWQEGREPNEEGDCSFQVNLGCGLASYTSQYLGPGLRGSWSLILDLMSFFFSARANNLGFTVALYL